MDYRTGKFGRVVTIRFDHGEDLLKGLKEIVLREKIKSCWFQIVGALGQAGVVIGPKEPVVPPEPVWQEVNDVREVIGSGSIHMDADEPKIHLHAVMGHHGETLTGCVRRNSKVYLTLEVILFELLGLNASRPWDEENGCNLLTFSRLTDQAESPGSVLHQTEQKGKKNLMEGCSVDGNCGTF